MADRPAAGFELVGTSNAAAIPGGVNVLLRWRLSGTPDGQWAADFEGPCKMAFDGRWELDLPRSRRGQAGPIIRGQIGPSVTGSKIVWVIPTAHREEVERFVARQVDQANERLSHRELGPVD